MRESDVDLAKTRMRECLDRLVDVSHDFKALPVDELALDFADWFEMLAGLHRASLSIRQIACLNSLNAYLDAISGEFHADLWTWESFGRKPEWSDVRVLATLAAQALSD